MTDLTVSFIDAFVARFTAESGHGGLELLLLRRAQGKRSEGSWETVHGHIDPGENPVEAAIREVREEAGIEPERFYNLSRVEAFYRHTTDEVAVIPAFLAVVGAEARVTMGPEHDDFAWLEPDSARTRFAWPRERRAVDDIVTLLGSGHAGALEQALLIDLPPRRV